MLNALQGLIITLTGEGGLLRVRAWIALGMTGIGGAFLLINQVMPPAEFNLMWATSIAYYFGTRGGS